jgi:hypothetical protein
LSGPQPAAAAEAHQGQTTQSSETNRPAAFDGSRRLRAFGHAVEHRGVASVHSPLAFRAGRAIESNVNSLFS